jgi:uncharacterized protein YcfJ
MNASLRNALGVAALLVAAQAGAQMTLYSGEDFRGPSVTTDHAIGNFGRTDFNDRASSVVVNAGRWEVCEHAHFEGRCMVLRPGNYPSLASMGLNDRISSVREVPRHAGVTGPQYASGAQYAYGDFRRRDNERLFEVPVSSARAVVGTPEQRCWIEREQVVENRGDNSVPGAIAGAVIGGILGHQIGGGRGQDIATAGGAVGGAVIGSQLGRQSGGSQIVDRDVQRCATVQNSERIAYWDVTYYFRGQEHRVQLAQAPGSTITVNELGEPRA